MENVNTNRRCGCCEEIGHDIRNCPFHIERIDANLIRDFTNNGNNAVFPLFNRRILRKLGDKYGLSRQLTDNQYLERLILIYSNLGEQRRIERRNRRNEENQERIRQEQIFRNLPTLLIQEPTNNVAIAQALVPFPLTPNNGRFRNILSLQDLNSLRDSFQQLSFEIEHEIVERIEGTSPKFIIDPSKFTEDNLECECPICYEYGKSVLTNCSHLYCGSCINKMIHQRNNNHVSCALCREKVTTVYMSADTLQI